MELALRKQLFEPTDEAKAEKHPVIMPPIETGLTTASSWTFMIPLILRRILWMRSTCFPVNIYRYFKIVSEKNIKSSNTVEICEDGTALIMDHVERTEAQTKNRLSKCMVWDDQFKKKATNIWDIFQAKRTSHVLLDVF